MIEILTFDQVTNITQNLLIIIVLALLVVIPSSIYLFLGLVLKGRSANGTISKKRLIENPNFWIAFVLYGLIQTLIIILLIYPVWLNMLN